MAALLALLLCLCTLASNALAVLSKERIGNVILRGNADDPFDSLSEEELQKEWSIESDESALERVEKLEHNFVEYVYVDVKLILGSPFDQSLKEACSPLSRRAF